MKAVSERKTKVEETLQKAQNLNQEAVDLKEKYQNRLQDWEKEKEEKRNAFKKELDQEKFHKEQLLEKELEKKKEKLRAQEEQRLAQQKRNSQEEAVKLAAQFSSQILKKLAGPELEQNIVSMFLEDIRTLPESKIRQLKNRVKPDKETPIEVKTAFPLESAQKEQLQNALKSLCGDGVTFEFNQDSDLVAGLSVNLGPLILEADLRDELSFFTEVAWHGE